MRYVERSHRLQLVGTGQSLDREARPVPSHRGACRRDWQQSRVLGGNLQADAHSHEHSGAVFAHALPLVPSEQRAYSPGLVRFGPPVTFGPKLTPRVQMFLDIFPAYTVHLSGGIRVVPV